MRIGIAVPNFPPARFEGGISHYSAFLGEHLSLLGHKVYAITSAEFTVPVDRSELTPSVEIIRIPGPWGFKTVKFFKGAIEDFELDVIILQYSPASFNSGFRLGWAWSSFSCQKITAFHTLWGRSIDRFVGISVLFGSPKIIATNSEIMTILEKRIPYLLKRTYWIPIGSNILPSKDLMIEGRTPEPLVVYFGMLYPGKGVSMILDVAELLRKRGQFFSLKIVGGGGADHKSYEDEIQKEITTRRLNNSIEYVGFLPSSEISMYLKKSRVVFLPYDSGLSDRRGSFMAAIAHGKAVLTKKPIVNMPFLKKGVNVIWPDEDSVSGYADMLELLLKDNHLVNILEEGASALSRKFAWERIASEYAMVIKQES